MFNFCDFRIVYDINYTNESICEITSKMQQIKKIIHYLQVSNSLINQIPRISVIDRVLQIHQKFMEPVR